MFGISNAPQAFSFLLHILKFPKEICKHYFDDLICPATTYEENLRKIEDIFKRMLMENLTLKPYKCDYLMTTLCMVGVEVNKDGTRPSEAHLRTIKQIQHQQLVIKPRRWWLSSTTFENI